MNVEHGTEMDPLEAEMLPLVKGLAGDKPKATKASKAPSVDPAALDLEQLAELVKQGRRDRPKACCTDGGVEAHGAAKGDAQSLREARSCIGD